MEGLVFQGRHLLVTAGVCEGWREVGRRWGGVELGGWGGCEDGTYGVGAKVVPASSPKEEFDFPSVLLSESLTQARSQCWTENSSQLSDLATRDDASALQFMRLLQAGAEWWLCS